MFSAPLIWSSIGDTTVAATTSALAPGYWPFTLMIGGAISGYWATGSLENDTAPRMTKTIDTTAAKIGRLMKKCEIRISRPQSALMVLAALAASASACGLPGDLAGGAPSLGGALLVGPARPPPVDDARV